MNELKIKDNIDRIRENIAVAAEASGRCGSDIALVAASKTKPAEAIQAAIAAGIKDVGENRVDEMLEKNKQNAYTGAALHFIGTLQSNKVNKIVGLCSLIETVSSEKLIDMINARASVLGIVQNVLLEVNIGRELQKTGILPEDLDEILAYASGKKSIKIQGLMAIPPFCDDYSTNYSYFDTMYQLFVDMRAKKYDNSSVHILSMGMSESYIYAIRAGANMVRIGSAIFGER